MVLIDHEELSSIGGIIQIITETGRSGVLVGSVDIPGSRPESDEDASRREDDAGWWSRQAVQQLAAAVSAEISEWINTVESSKGVSDV